MGEHMAERPVDEIRTERWDGMKRTMRHVMITAAILGVAAAIAFLVLADVMCLGDLCR